MGQPAVLLIMSGALVDVGVVDVDVVDDEVLQALITSIPTTATAVRTEVRKIFIFVFIFRLPSFFTAQSVLSVTSRTERRGCSMAGMRLSILAETGSAFSIPNRPSQRLLRIT